VAQHGIESVFAIANLNVPTLIFQLSHMWSAAG
jgi:hypothetical protein